MDHLHPSSLEYDVPSKDEKPVRRYTVDVIYSMHCFTRKVPVDGMYDRRLLYSDRRETRLFDVRRFKLSKQLPSIIADLQRRKCRHTGHGNFFTVALVDDDGKIVDYDIFFTVSKSSIRGRLNLFIQSAFVRDKAKLPGGRPIRFEIILDNTLRGKPIKD